MFKENYLSSFFLLPNSFTSLRSTYIYIYIHTNKHTYIHTYIHTYTTQHNTTQHNTTQHNTTHHHHHTTTILLPLLLTYNSFASHFTISSVSSSPPPSSLPLVHLSPSSSRLQDFISRHPAGTHPPLPSIPQQGKRGRKGEGEGRREGGREGVE